MYYVYKVLFLKSRANFESCSCYLTYSYLDSCSSGVTNSSTSLVGILLIFSDFRAGIASSKTQPLKGKSSEVRIRSRQMNWSLSNKLLLSMELKLDEVGTRPLWVGPNETEDDSGLWPAKVKVVVGKSFSRRMEMAVGPRFSSLPNQF